MKKHSPSNNCIGNVFDVFTYWKNTSDQRCPRDLRLFRIMAAQLRTLRTSQHYRIEGFKGAPKEMQT